MSGHRLVPITNVSRVFCKCINALHSGKNYHQTTFRNMFSYFSQEIEFDIPCELSPVPTVCINVTSCFQGKIQTISTLSSGESVQTVIKVKVPTKYRFNKKKVVIRYKYVSSVICSCNCLLQCTKLQSTLNTIICLLYSNTRNSIYNRAAFPWHQEKERLATNNNR